MHRLWLPIGSVLAVFALGFGTFNIVSVLAHEEVTETAAFEAAGLEALRVRSDNGTVEILGGDRDDVALTAHVSHGLRRTTTSAEVRGDTLVVESDCPGFPMVWCSVDYRLEIPDDLDVDVDTRNGRIEIRDVHGHVDVQSSNGPIDLARLDGPVDARTSNGPVEARGLRGERASVATSNGPVALSFAEPPTSVQVATSNGPVEIILPEDPDVAYSIDADTNFVGRTDIGVRTDPTSDRSIAASTSNGSVTVRYPTG